MDQQHINNSILVEQQQIKIAKPKESIGSFGASTCVIIMIINEDNDTVLCSHIDAINGTNLESHFKSYNEFISELDKHRIILSSSDMNYSLRMKLMHYFAMRVYKLNITAIPTSQLVIDENRNIITDFNIKTQFPDKLFLNTKKLIDKFTQT